MGRPARQPDELLTKRVQEFVDQSKSVRCAALIMGLVPTTLSRSLQARAFDQATRRKIESKLGTAHEAHSQKHLEVARPESAVQNVLHILQELSRILPTAIVELEAARAQSDSLVPGPKQ